MSTPMAQTSSYTEAELTRYNVKCKFKYRIRWFYSRGSFLVLIWNLLIFASVNSQVFLSENFYSGLSIPFNIYYFVFSTINCVIRVYSTLWVVG